MEEQYTKEWWINRLGKFTGSQIGAIMSKGRAKDQLFGQTAMTYIYSVASERDLLKAYIEDDYLWEIYLNQISFSNKYTEFGHDNEALAAEIYEGKTKRISEKIGSVIHPYIPNFAASPDRITHDNELKVCVEIKCPTPKVYMKYKNEVSDGKSLLSVEPKYFYQVQAEMMCTQSDVTDFVLFCPFLRHNIHIVRIFPDKAVQDEIAFRISEAEKIINDILNK